MILPRPSQVRFDSVNYKNILNWTPPTTSSSLQYNVQWKMWEDTHTHTHMQEHSFNYKKGSKTLLQVTVLHDIQNIKIKAFIQQRNIASSALHLIIVSLLLMYQQTKCFAVKVELTEFRLHGVKFWLVPRSSWHTGFFFLLSFGVGLGINFDFYNRFNFDSQGHDFH